MQSTLTATLRAALLASALGHGVAAGAMAQAPPQPTGQAVAGQPQQPPARTMRGETGEIRVETVVSGLVHPWGLAFMPDGRFLVTERNDGRLRIGTPDGRLSPPVQGVPQVYSYSGPTGRMQAGLFDVATHPRFAENRLVYLSLAQWTEEGAGTAVFRGRLEEGDQPRLDGVERIFIQNNRDGSGLHFGGRLAFHPEDGTLFLSIGERRNINTAQDASDHRGSIIRMADDGAVPRDNPFVNDDDKDDHVFSYGHRNIQAMGFRPGNGELWVADHGPQGGDEINLVEAGKNYGWPYLTGGVDYSGAPIGVGTEREGMESPRHVFDETVAPSGLAFYQGDAFARWRGQMLVGGLAKRGVVRVEVTENGVEQREVLEIDRRIRDVAVHPDGSVWLLTEHEDGEVLRLVPAGG